MSPPQNAEDVHIGPLPLPWLIPICIFTPAFLSFIAFVIYRYTVVRHRRKKQIALGEGAEAMVSADVERQVSEFLARPERRAFSVHDATAVPDVRKPSVVSDARKASVLSKAAPR
jgi:hypothetical protein